MASFYQRFLNKNIDLSPLGVESTGDFYPYFCTPRGARILGWAGVDGIHFCFVRGFGEMVFAVSPMNTPGDYVHPLARTFRDFLRLLLSCDAAALEQAHGWDKMRFEEFVWENPPTGVQKATRRALAEGFGLTPMEEPYDYLKNLQLSFDYGKIPFTEDYDDPDMSPAARAAEAPADTVRLTLDREETEIPGPQFRASAPGDTVELRHPVTGTVYTLTVRDCGAHELGQAAFRRDDLEYPTHFLVLTYTIEPELPAGAYWLKDCNEGDSPRAKELVTARPEVLDAASVGVIGGAVSVVALTAKGEPRAVCSSLYFQPPETVQWQLIFREKTKEDVAVDVDL